MPTKYAPPGPATDLAEAMLSNADTWIVRLLIVCFTLFALMPYGLSWDYTGTSELTKEGSLTIKLEWGSLFLVAVYLLYRNPAEALRFVRNADPFLLLALAWCLLTSFWSPIPGTTFKRAAQLVGIAMIGLCLQLPRQALLLFCRYLLYTLTSILIFSLVMVVLNPGIGIDYELGGAWRGVLSQKNELGQVAALCILLWQVRACGESVGTRALLAGLLFSLFMLLMSKSSTSVLITVLTSATFHLLRKKHVESNYALTRLAVGGGMVVLIALYIFFMQESRLPDWGEVTAPIASAFGKGSDLTGRTDIWQLVWMEIEKHWWFGLGHGAFWLGPDSLSQYVIDALHWIPLQSHNGYLDILNEQGLAGLSLTVLVLLSHFLKLVRIARLDRHQAAFWSTVLLTIVVTNFTESSLFRGFTFNNVLFIFALVAIDATLYRLKRAEVQAGH